MLLDHSRSRQTIGLSGNSQVENRGRKAVATVRVDGSAVQVGRELQNLVSLSRHGFNGFLTSAAARGASLFKMMDVSRHKSVDTLRGYVRDADAFRDHVGAGLL